MQPQQPGIGMKPDASLPCMLCDIGCKKAGMHLQAPPPLEIETRISSQCHLLLSFRASSHLRNSWRWEGPEASSPTTPP